MKKGPDLAEKIYDNLRVEHARFLHATKPFPKAEWLRVAREVIKAETSKKNRPKNILGAGLTDEDWIKWLEAWPELVGIDVRDEIRRCKIYFAGIAGGVTRQRIMKWFSRVDRKIGIVGKVGAHIDPYKEPENGSWKRPFQEIYGGSPTAEEVRDGAKGWFELPLSVRRKVLERMAAE